MTAERIRPLATLEERRACVALQESTWGEGFPDRVPASILMIAAETGGVASGAFDGGQLVGFVFGITGLRSDGPVHWSDMLAVRESHRGRGLGFRLKLHQRELLLERGVGTVLWSFDPLEARNAYLNLRRLGATARSYRRDMYGASPSPLHAGIGTDRLMAEWEIDSRRVRDRLAGGAVRSDNAEERPLLNPPELSGPRPRPSSGHAAPSGPAVEVAVPADIQALKAADADLAAAWRADVRAALEAAFEAGYTAVDLLRGERVARYVLTRGFSR